MIYKKYREFLTEHHAQWTHFHRVLAQSHLFFGRGYSNPHPEWNGEFDFRSGRAPNPKWQSCQSKEAVERKTSVYYSRWTVWTFVSLQLLLCYLVVLSLSWKLQTNGRCFASLSDFQLNCDKHVEVEAGKSVVLPCFTEPQLKLRMVHWTRNDDQDVHLYRDKTDDLEGQNPDFKNRTSLFHSEILKGNCSLTLARMTPTYSGTYACRVGLHSNNDHDFRVCSITLRGK